jgi:pimeloyl-ACP methyl ester carboxylesterase
VTLPSGITLNYVRAGAGPVLIFIHGAMGDWRSWGPQWQAFLPHFDCISYSRRYSDPNPNPMNTRSHNALVDAEDLVGLMDALGIEKAVLVGSSYGGFTALATALKVPDRVLAVVAVEAPMMRYAQMTSDGAATAEAFLTASARPAREAFERGENEKAVQILTGGIVGRKPDAIPPEVMARRMRNVHAARSLALSDDEFPLLDPQDLARLPMPIMLMSGAQTAPVHAAIFANVTKVLSQARVRIVEGSGHSVSQQQPEVFNSEVLSFLSDHSLTKAPIEA